MTGIAQLPLDLGHRPALGRDDFLVAPANAEAVAWLDRWPIGRRRRWCWPDRRAAARPIWRRFSPARSGAVLPRAADADRRRPARPPRRRARRHPRRCRSAPTAEALLHLYNLLAERGGHLLLLARAAAGALGHRACRFALAPPRGAGGELAAARRRAASARPGEALRRPPDPGRRGGRRLSRAAARTLLRRGRRIVAALDRAALAAHRPVTVPLARAVLGEAPARR